MLGASLAIGAGTAAAIIAGPRQAEAAPPSNLGINAGELGLHPSNSRDQSGAVQYAIDKATQKNMPLLLPPGNYLASTLTLRPGSQIIGVQHKSRLIYTGNGTFLTADKADNIVLKGIAIYGNNKPLDLKDDTTGLISLSHCKNLTLKNIQITQSLVNGISLRSCSGRLTDLSIEDCINTGLFSLDAEALQISHLEITDCGNNGIQIWRSKPGEDGTIISNCHIKNIKAKSGGSGEGGNGINIFRAGSVTLTSNRITDCAFSAIRGNAASNIIMSNNNCTRLGEVALYAEFGFEAALITCNLVEDAATGISVTNFDQGGRLAVLQGNLIRNLKRREQGDDKRGTGISVEADTIVASNIIENAPTMGLRIGWGKYVRDVSATGNLIRASTIGIGISADLGEGLIHVASNMISGAKDGAIRAMLHDKPTGPDLVLSSAESYRNFALLGNVSS